jgi:formate dehydrogenase iron-sulfur subunit
MTDNDVVMVIDTSKCTACRSCQVACKQWHSLPAEDTTFTGTYTNPPDVSGANLTVVKFLEKEIAGKLRFLFFHERCRHCDNPLCKSACPKGAISKSPVGIVRIDHNLCIPIGAGACTTAPSTVLRPCQTACPYKTTDGAGMPRWQYNLNGAPQLSKMRKCDFCYNKLAEVGDGAFTDLNVPPFNPTPGVRSSTLPSCVTTCPPGAILINRLGAIKPIVVARLNKLKTSGYPNAIVYPYQWPGVMTHVNWILIEHPTVYGLTY